MGLDAKTEQMIALVMQINGYAKADDLQALSPEQRQAALRTYYQEHSGASPMHWRGEQLWDGPDPSAHVPTPAAVEAPAATDMSTQSIPEVEAPAYATLVPTAPVSPAASPSAGGPDVFGDLFPEPAPAAASVATLEPLGTSPFGEEPVATVTPAPTEPLSAEPIAAEVAPAYASPVDSRLDSDFLPEPAFSPEPLVADNAPVSFLWWLLAILWAPIGGLIAYAVVRGTNPRGAAKVLKVSLIVWGAAIVLALLAGAVAIFALA